MPRNHKRGCPSLQNAGVGLGRLLLVGDFDVTGGGRIDGQTQRRLDFEPINSAAGRSNEEWTHNSGTLIRRGGDGGRKCSNAREGVGDNNTGGVGENLRPIRRILRVRSVRADDDVGRIRGGIVELNGSVGRSREEKNFLNRVLTAGKDGKRRGRGDRGGSHLVRTEGGEAEERE